MLKRLIIAIVIFGGFLFVATQTPLEKYFFQYKSADVNPYDVNQYQIVDEADVSQIEEENRKDIHVNESKPTKLEIPSLNVSATIHEVGLTSKGAMATLNGPTPIAWYKYGAIPGGEGNAILAGHREWNGVMGTLFYLETMKKGDTLKITYEDGLTQKFELVSSNLYPMNDVPKEVMELDGESRLTIITCGGTFNKKRLSYDSRVVTIFKAVN